MHEALPEWPMFGLSDDARPALRAARDAGVPAALATITALGGGGPRPVGTQMVLAEGIVSGFLSGGCLESDVAGHARQVLDDGEPPASDLVLGPGDVLTLGVVFAVPSGHNAAAYLVVLNSFTVARRWLRLSGRWSETRKLIVPDQEAA